MVFGLFKKKDPICGMKEEDGKGFVDEKTGHWFCNQNCKDEFDKGLMKMEQKRSKHKGSCCH